MFLHAEKRRLPAVDVVAFRAFAILRARIKLPFVRIGSMAVFAVRKGQLFLKVAIPVASDAGNLGVFSKQGILGF